MCLRVALAGVLEQVLYGVAIKGMYAALHIARVTPTAAASKMQHAHACVRMQRGRKDCTGRR